MEISLELLTRLFENIDRYYTFDEVKQLGLLFFKCVKENGYIDNLQEDWWIQMSVNFDVNFYEMWGHWYMCIYRQTDGVTDTRNGAIANILLDTRMTF